MVIWKIMRGSIKWKIITLTLSGNAAFGLHFVHYVGHVVIGSYGDKLMSKYNSLIDYI